MSDFHNSRRQFLKMVTTTAVLPAAPVPFITASLEPESSALLQSAAGETGSSGLFDGPASSLFETLAITGNKKLSQLNKSLVSEDMADATDDAPVGASTAWGIPFDIQTRVFEPFSIFPEKI